MLAASCSAADAMMSYPWPRCGPYRRPLPVIRRNRSAYPLRARLGWRRPALTLGFDPAADNDCPPGSLDRCDRRLGRAGHLDRDRRRHLPFREQANPIPGASQYAGSDKGRRVDRPLGAEAFGVDSLLQAPEIDDFVVLLEDLVIEAALWQAAMQRRLAALEPVDCDAAACGLALAAAPRCLALARPDAAPEPLRPVMRARIVSDLVELHRIS